MTQVTSAARARLTRPGPPPTLRAGTAPRTMRILFFAHLKNLTGCPAVELPGDDLDCDELWARLLERFPALAAVRAQVRLSRNCDFADATTRFRAADEVALLPPVSGG